MPDLDKIQRNIEKMKSMGATDEEIKIYQQGEMASVQSQVPMTTAPQMQTQFQLPNLELQGVTTGKTSSSLRWGQPTKETETTKTRRITRQGLASNINRLENLFSTIPSAEGIQGRMIGLKEWAKGIAGYNPKLTTYNDFKKVIVGQLAITIGGESGSRLSDQDINRMINAFPDEWKTTSERKEKWRIFKDTANEIAIAYGAEPIFAETQTSQSKNQLTPQNILEGLK